MGGLVLLWLGMLDFVYPLWGLDMRWDEGGVGDWRSEGKGNWDWNIKWEKKMLSNENKKSKFHNWEKKMCFSEHYMAIVLWTHYSCNCLCMTCTRPMEQGQPFFYQVSLTGFRGFKIMKTKTKRIKNDSNKIKKQRGHKNGSQWSSRGDLEVKIIELQCTKIWRFETNN